jgi:hypothetical protein
MPVLPRLETSQSIFNNTPLQSQQIQTSPEQFGGEIAQGVGQLAQGTQQAGNNVGDIATRQIDLQRETSANNQYANSFSPALRDVYSKYYALQGKDAVDQLPDFQKQIQDLQQTQRAQLQDPIAQRMFDQVSTRRVQMELDGMSRYADQQNKVYQQQASDGMVKSFQQQAVDKWNDPIVFNGMVNSVTAERMSHAAATGQPVEYAKATIAQDVSKMWTDRLQMMANQDPVRAYQTLESGEDWAANGQSQHTDVKTQIDPAVLPSLESHLLGGAKQVLARNIAHSMIYGGGAVDPTTLQPAIQGQAPLQAAVESMESGGKDFDANGNLLTSSKGAQGRMQVMGPTAANPGFGVTPAKDNSPEELARVGRDYLGAMTARYQDPALTLAAYNAGPRQVDKWIAKYGDPRAGQISDADWAAKIPFSETRGYVAKGLGMIQQPGDKPTALPTTAELKTVLPQKVQQAQDMASKMFPNDPSFADAVGSRVASYGNTILAGVTANEMAARDTLTRIMMGSKPDGSDKVTSMDQLMANPEAKSAWAQATPEIQEAIQTRLSKANVPLTQDGLNEFYRLRGEAANNPDQFMQENLASTYGKMPDNLVLQLINQQTSISKKDANAAARDLNWTRTKSDVEDMLKPMGLGATAKTGTPKADLTAQFYGKLNEALDQYHDQNKKYPDTTTTRKIAASLLVQGTQDSGHWYSANKTMPAFESPDLSQFSVPVPAAQKQQLSQSFQRVMGHAPTDSELQQWYTRFSLAQKGK